MSALAMSSARRRPAGKSSNGAAKSAAAAGRIWAMTRRMRREKMTKMTKMPPKGSSKRRGRIRDSATDRGTATRKSRRKGRIARIVRKVRTGQMKKNTSHSQSITASFTTNTHTQILRCRTNRSEPKNSSSKSRSSKDRILSRANGCSVRGRTTAKSKGTALRAMMGKDRRMGRINWWSLCLAIQILEGKGRFRIGK